MSGTGKSTVLGELARWGHPVVDTDYDDWCDEVPRANGSGAEPLWNEDRMTTLLAEHADGALFVAGCVANQGRFYDRFDAVVLLSAPLEVVLERVRTRETNDFGKNAAERERIVGDHAAVEPLLRAGATVELDTRSPLAEVVHELASLAEQLE